MQSTLIWMFYLYIVSLQIIAGMIVKRKIILEIARNNINNKSVIASKHNFDFLLFWRILITMLHIGEYIYCHYAKNMARNWSRCNLFKSKWIEERCSLAAYCVPPWTPYFIILLFCRASFVLIYTVDIKEELWTADCVLRTTDKV